MMSITIGDYPFEGPYKSTSNLLDRAGIYAILTLKTNGKYSVVDVGESANVKTRVENHDRKDCWRRNSNNIVLAAYYTPNLQQSGRMMIEQDLRDRYNAPCGER